MSEQTGLSRSYLNYLEHGRFKEVGVDKFARLVMAMKLSADQVLAEAGYLTKKPNALPDPESYLRSQYKLSPANLAVAMRFLEFLADGKKHKPKAEREASRPR